MLGFPIKKMNGKVVWAFSIKKKKEKKRQTKTISVCQCIPSIKSTTIIQK